jgi:hypothetical protein
MMLKKKLKVIKFNDSEDIDDFGMRLSSLILQLGVLSMKNIESEVVHKFLFVIPPRFS